MNTLSMSLSECLYLIGIYMDAKTGAYNRGRSGDPDAKAEYARYESRIIALQRRIVQIERGAKRKEVVYG